MQLTPDTTILFTLGPIPINATIAYTWLLMALLVLVSWLVTRNLRPDTPPGRWRNALEVTVTLISDQIHAIADHGTRHVLYFAGTLFLFIAASNMLVVIPGFQPPTGSLSTTLALTLAVLLAVPVFGIAHGGLRHYLKTLVEPSIIILPFNIIGEFSKAVSLSVRLYGNVMSGAVIAAILLGIAPFFFPVIMELFGLLIGLIQAYIFAILATVYISAAMASPQDIDNQEENT